MKNVYYYLSALLGEVVIVGICLELMPLIGENVTYLNIGVLSLLYVLCWIRFFIPLIKKDEAAQSWVGSLGIKMAGIQFLIFCTILTMIGCNIGLPEHQLPFRYQLYIYIAIFAIFFLYMAFSEESSDKVKEVYIEEKAKEQGVKSMKSVMQNLIDAVDLCNDMPAEVKDHFRTINESLRFISPNITDEALRLEKNFCIVAESLYLAVENGYKLNADTINKSLPQLELYLKRRKDVKN